VGKEEAKSDQISLDVIIREAEKTFDNAERLFFRRSYPLRQRLLKVVQQAVLGENLVRIAPR
jgi:hypothetical protein